jgi:agmatine deiminase
VGLIVRPTKGLPERSGEHAGGEEERSQRELGIDQAEKGPGGFRIPVRIPSRFGQDDLVEGHGLNFVWVIGGVGLRNCREGGRLMIADHETNVVFVADTLERRFPAVYGGLKTILSEHGILFRTIPGTRDVWCRDYMPVQVAEDRFVQFRYAPDYLTGKYRHLRADGLIGAGLPFMRNCELSEIVLDGGNLVKWSNKVILTDKILKENVNWKVNSLLAELERLLDVRQVILIPGEPGDKTGHADGVVRFVNDGKVIVNDYGRVDRSYRKKLLRSLEKSGLEVTEVPYRPAPELLDGIPSAVGNYINFLQVGSAIVAPKYVIPEDVLAHEKLIMAFQRSKLIGLECRELATYGGVLNCSTWTFSRAGIENTWISGDPSRRLN